jgi:hypothetical protein
MLGVVETLLLITRCKPDNRLSLAPNYSPFDLADWHSKRIEKLVESRKHAFKKEGVSLGFD